jgi:hypothetical protein
MILKVRQPLGTQIRTALITIKNFIVQYNLFPSSSPVVSDREIRNQKISTYLFVIIMAVSFIILTVYTALQQVTKTISVKQPDYITYQKLYLQRSENLSCPCTTISVEQGMFVDIKPTFHPICSSDFVSDTFLSYLLATPKVPLWYGYHRFKLIASLCHLSNATITNSLAVFNNSRFVSGEVLSNDLFNKYINDIVDHYIKTINNSFILSLSFIRNTTIGNKFMNGYATNTIILATPVFMVPSTYYVTSLYPDSCDCLLEPCTSLLTIQSPSGLFLNIPGTYHGCYIVDSILKSDLQCFFDLNCTKLYLTIYHQTKFNISILDSSTTRFSISDSIDSLVGHLFVENWTTSISHVHYFNRCKPSSCSYTIQTKDNLLTVLILTIGLLGGLQVVLRFIVPKMIQFICYRCFIKRDTDDKDREKAGEINILIIT